MIPALSAISPIRQALSTNLNDALSTQRTKQNGLIASTSSQDWESRLQYVLFGTMGVLFGVSIYYYLPMSLLKENIDTMLQIFFIILLGMILGLTILAMNFQGLL